MDPGRSRGILGISGSTCHHRSRDLGLCLRGPNRSGCPSCRRPAIPSLQRVRWLRHAVRRSMLDRNHPERAGTSRTRPRSDCAGASGLCRLSIPDRLAHQANHRRCRTRQRAGGQAWPERQDQSIPRVFGAAIGGVSAGGPVATSPPVIRTSDTATNAHPESPDAYIPPLSGTQPWASIALIGRATPASYRAFSPRSMNSTMLSRRATRSRSRRYIM